jgi:peroxiredoxin
MLHNSERTLAAGAGSTLPRAARGLIGAVSLVGALTSCDPAPLLVQPGHQAPAFSLPRLDGSKVEFPGEYRGQVVAVRFWADWCPYCRSEMAALEPVYHRYRQRGLAYLAVNVMQPREQVEGFVHDLELSADVLLDSDGQVTRRYGVMGLPVTVFVDRDGIVRSRIVGESTAETFAGIVEPLLGAGPEPPVRRPTAEVPGGDDGHAGRPDGSDAAAGRTAPLRPTGPGQPRAG